MVLFKDKVEKELEEALGTLDPVADSKKYAELSKALADVRANRNVIKWDTIVTVLAGIGSATLMLYLNKVFGLMEPKETRWLKH